MSQRRRDEAGQTTIMIVGLAIVLMLTIAVVVDASAAYLQRQGLDNIADGAALAGADAGANGEEIYSSGLDDRLDLFAASAQAGVADYLSSTDARVRYPGFSYRMRVNPAEESVVVEVSADLDLPLTFPGSPERTRIGSTGSAVVRTDRDEP